MWGLPPTTGDISNGQFVILGFLDRRGPREGLNKALRIGVSTEIAVVRDSARVPGLFIGVSLQRVQPLVAKADRLRHIAAQ
jgi:hypothetical protein